eukprot:4086344-Prymnesium_polylepis.1
MYCCNAAAASFSLNSSLPCALSRSATPRRAAASCCTSGSWPSASYSHAKSGCTDSSGTTASVPSSTYSTW